jgi:integrase
MKRSTKSTDKRLAEKLARQFEDESRAKRTAAQARRILASIYKDLAGEELATTTVRDFMNGFVARKEPEVSKATHDYYTGHAKRFLEWLGQRADSDLADITKQDLTGYRNFVATKTGARTVNNSLKAIRTFFTAAKKDGFIADNPATDVDTVRDRSESNRRPFTLPELQSLMAVAGEEWRSMIRFGFYTGQRLGDIATLTWQNIDTAKNEIRLTTRKTGRRQALPLPSALIAHIGTMKVGEDAKAPLHPTAFAIIQKGRAGPLSKSFGDLLEAAGLRIPTTADKGNARAKYDLSFHSLRHTATSILKEAGIPQSVVMDFIGHDSADVSAGYTHTGREALEKAANAFPTI